MKSLSKVLLLTFVQGISISAQINKTEKQTNQLLKGKLIVQQILKLNREYSDMIQRGNVAEIEHVLAGDYLLTDESGKVFSKADDLAGYKNPIGLAFRNLLSLKLIVCRLAPALSIRNIESQKRPFSRRV
jgi:hypothetical protein